MGTSPSLRASARILEIHRAIRRRDAVGLQTFTNAQMPNARRDAADETS
jgi:hypothetical protein